MILSLDELRTLLTGAVHCAVEDGVLAPYRFTPYMENVPYAAGNPFHALLEHTSGITLDFFTDAEALCFDFTLLRPRADQAFDVAKDGNLLCRVTSPAHKGHAEIDLGEGQKRVTITYPFYAAGRIANLNLVNATQFSPVTGRKKWLAIGDSITHGVFAHFPSMTYAHATARKLGVELFDQALSGEGFRADGLDADFPFTPDLITVAYGTNSWSHDPSRAAFVGQSNGFLAALRDRYPNTPIALLLPIWREDYTLTTKKVGSFALARDLLRTAARKYGIAVIDAFDFVPHLPDFFYDGKERCLHPNDLGFFDYAEHLAPALSEVLHG